ncbi:histidinol dehydrogenase [Verrucomicrobiaceae bacterium 5K15]|uniref:Histidinol dehydrogenase n=1 Tax=Oceaniferula flava TaxID=2800421 RepID=A0AAE2VB73_9BACT|nr:histidinol dehydrogenase [Oceaniferula flavus]MBK1854220.1 histidinol dehydrogenase [Oceaniferula flavus]MBM1135526.1 histidinol dehydrogenase [Oceaniferula flavus]
MKVLSHKDAAYARFVKKLNRRAVPGAAGSQVEEIVSSIVSDVQKRGNAAVFEYTEKFDGLRLSAKSLFVSQEEIDEAYAAVDADVKKAVAASRRNIHAFAKRSMRKDWKAKNREGVIVGERFTPYDRVGVYVPGGKAPLVSSALMTAAFGQATGVPEILAATPAGKDGKINPALLYALVESGATEIIKVGGAQAIAAMALGTKSVLPVEKIFGPGNSFVVEAKRQLVGAVSIDLLPGPSEVLIVADKTANAQFIAADMLAQAEHGGDSVIGFATNSKALLNKVEKELEKQAAELSREKYLREVLKNGTFCLLTKSIEEAVEICNAFAPEHLSLVVENEDCWLDQIRTAGAIYVGPLAAVAVGDFLAGPSHTLPTGGSGKSFSGLRADQFQRRASIVRMDQQALQKSLPAVETFSRVEGLDAHGRSVSIRVE